MKSFRPLVGVFCLAALVLLAVPAGAQTDPQVPYGTYPSCVSPVSPIDSPRQSTTPSLGYLLVSPHGWTSPMILVWSPSSRVLLSNRVPSAVVREPQRGSLRLSWGSWARVVSR
jgi:hypothetical protein